MFKIYDIDCNDNIVAKIWSLPNIIQKNSFDNVLNSIK